MAKITRKPRSATITVSPARDYSGVASAYKSILKAAKEQEDQAELEARILSYNDGELTYSDLKRYLKQRINSAPDGTLKKVRLQETLSNLEKTEREKNKRIKRSQLEAQYAKDGITAVEQLRIEEELLNLEKEGTPEWEEQKNIVEAAKQAAREAEKNRVIAELEATLSEGGLSSSEKISLIDKALEMVEPGSEDYYSLQAKRGIAEETLRSERVQQELDARKNELLTALGSGGITTAEKLQIVEELLKIAEPGTKEYSDLIDERADIQTTLASEASSASNLQARTSAEEEIFKILNQIVAPADKKFSLRQMTGEEHDKIILDSYERINELIDQIEAAGGSVSDKDKTEAFNRMYQAENNLEGRATGEVVDVIDREGNIKTVSLAEIIEDRKGIFRAPDIAIDESGLYMVLGPDGKPLEDTDTFKNSFFTKAEAIRAAEENNVASRIQVLSPNNEIETWFFNPAGDPEKGIPPQTFYKDTPENYFVSPIEDSKFKITEAVSGIGEEEKKKVVPKRFVPSFKLPTAGDEKLTAPGESKFLPLQRLFKGKLDISKVSETPLEKLKGVESDIDFSKRGKGYKKFTMFDPTRGFRDIGEDVRLKIANAQSALRNKIKLPSFTTMIPTFDRGLRDEKLRSDRKPLMETPPIPEEKAGFFDKVKSFGRGFLSKIPFFSKLF